MHSDNRLTHNFTLTDLAGRTLARFTLGEDYRPEVTDPFMVTGPFINSDQLRHFSDVFDPLCVALYICAMQHRAWRF
jgi:hypothetical protein